MVDELRSNVRSTWVSLRIRLPMMSMEMSERNEERGELEDDGKEWDATGEETDKLSSEQACYGYSDAFR